MITRFGLLTTAVLCLASAVVAEDPKPADLNQIRLYVPIPPNDLFKSIWPDDEKNQAAPDAAPEPADA